MNILDITKQIRAFADELEAKNKPTPEAPPFTLPTPPPGIKWHREDGWTAEMLPPGTRPLCKDEPNDLRTDEYCCGTGDGWDVQSIRHARPQSSRGFWRTTRSLLFTHEGHEWTWHRAGDPMPCDGNACLHYIMFDGHISRSGDIAKHLVWSDDMGKQNIIGWRYADAEKPAPKQKLGPSDVPPGSVFRPKSWKGASSYITLASVRQMVVYLNCIDLDKTECDQANGSAVSWDVLREMWLINRPKHRDASGNPTLWEACER